MQNPGPSYYEKRLQEEIEGINLRIRDLTQERQALERQLVKARQSDAAAEGITRKNSYTRIMVERRVEEALASKRWVSLAVLYKDAKTVDFELKYITFRGYLSRMKDKGMIENDGRKGRWRLKPENQDEQAKQEFAELLEKIAGEKKAPEAVNN